MQKHLKQRAKGYSAVLAVVVGLSGCSQNDQSAIADRPRVVASYGVLCQLSDQLAQDTIDLTCLVKPDEDPHAYTATPQDRQAIEEADLILYGGYDHEGAIAQLINASNTSTPKIAVHEEAVSNPIVSDGHHHPESEEHAHEAEEKEEKQIDPHVWHDVQNAIAMVNVIQNQLEQINPEQAENYSQNAEQIITQLEQLDLWIKEQIATIPPDQRKLVTTHDALAYYARAYGLEEIGALQGVIRSEQPKASRVKELVETLKKNNVPTIFAEVNVNEQIIETVAREANVKVAEDKLFVDNLGQAGSETGTYIGMMSYNTCAIVNGLGGQCVPFR